MSNKSRLFIWITATSFLCSSPAWAQQQPDAGQTMQELKEAPSLPTKSSLPELRPPKKPKATKAEGTKVEIQNITLNGNKIFTDEQLLPLVESAQGQKFTVAELKELADKITVFYFENDYPFARAIVPAQSIKKGKLIIEVIEGQYGDILINGTKWEEQAKRYLSFLEKGKIIKGKELERAALILDDQPGYSTVPVIRPGKEVGTGDLSFQVSEDDKPYTGSINLDNHGNRYTGRGRAQANITANSPFMFGDQINASVVYTEEQMWYGSANYSVPIGSSGLRGDIGFKHTNYELGKEFSSLDAHGTADILSAGLSYPLVRSQKENLSLAVGYKHKWLTDEQGSTGTENKKTSDVIPVALNFDRRDSFYGGGVTYGSLGWTHGVVDLDSSLAATDRTTASTDGTFDKVNFDISRLQNLSFKGIKSLSLSARIAGQKAFNNLDSSEDFGLGGTSGVRAYPTGEAYGDEGALGQFELRYALNKRISPYIFYDYGHIKTNQNPWASGDNDRTLGGAGLGARYSYGNWSADALAAWRTIGGVPQSDSRDYLPMIWFSMAYKF